MKRETCASRLKFALDMRNMKQSELADKTKIPKSAICQYVSGAFEPKQDRVEIISKALDISEAWLMGFDVQMERRDDSSSSEPNITEDYTTFPVIGEIAAGYDHIALETWESDTIDIPNSYLRGYPKDNFMVLRIVGDSMYPLYQDGDKVLILKQSTVNNSGDVGAVLYDSEFATLKKIEFVSGEEWLKLIPVNPLYKPEKVEGARLERCRIIGIPKLLVREIN